VQILKLSISAAMQLHSGHSMRQWPSPLYAIPAAAYMVSDNLVVLILTYLDPATMNLMWNLKVLWTALLMTLFLSKTITARQWGALGLLLLGVVVSKIPRLLNSPEGSTQHADQAAFIMGAAMAAGGSMVVSLGNVSCEFLMKAKGRNEDDTLHWQNFQIYFFGLLLNAAATSLSRSSSTGGGGSLEGFNGWAALLILNHSVAGIVLGVLLKYLDNIAVIYCHTIAMLLQTVLQYLFFGFPITGYFVAGVVLISVSLRAYYEKSVVVDSPLATQSEVSLIGADDHHDDPLASLTSKEV